MTPAYLYPRRELATHYLQLLLDRPHTALSLFGPRQIGKTTFITGDLSALASSSGIVPIYVDLMAASDKLESINGALRDAVYALKTRRTQERVRGVKALGMGIDFDAAPPMPTSADAGQQLQHLMADLLRQSGIRRVLLLLDEVQEVVRSKMPPTRLLRITKIGLVKIYGHPQAQANQLGFMKRTTIPTKPALLWMKLKC